MAAIFAATGFIGVLDMFMTLCTLLKSKDWEEAARKEREADRKERETDCQAREKERVENRAFQQQILDQLAADRQAQAEMTTRVIDLLEQMSHRINGNSNGSSGSGSDRQE